MEVTVNIVLANAMSYPEGQKEKVLKSSKLGSCQSHREVSGHLYSCENALSMYEFTGEKMETALHTWNFRRLFCHCAFCYVKYANAFL